MAWGSVVAVCMLAFALACSAQADPLAELKLLPGCGTADWARYEATATSAECREWDGKATLDPCPPSCQEAFTALGEECYARVAEFTWQRLGVMAEPATLALYVNATFEACDAGLPLQADAASAFLQDALQEFPTCDGAETDVMLGSGCSFDRLTEVVTSGSCPQDCTNFVLGMGKDCFVDFVMQGVRSLESLNPSAQAAARDVLFGVYDGCTLQQPPAEPTEPELPPMLPTDPGLAGAPPPAGSGIDPVTGLPAGEIDPVTGLPVGEIDPVTGLPAGSIDPVTGLPAGSIDPTTGLPAGSIDPTTGRPVGSVDPPTGLPANAGAIDPVTGLPLNDGPTDPAAGLPANAGAIDPVTGLPLNDGPTDPAAGLPANAGAIDPVTGQPLNAGAIDPVTGQPLDPSMVDPTLMAGAPLPDGFSDPFGGVPLDPAFADALAGAPLPDGFGGLPSDDPFAGGADPAAATQPDTAMFGPDAGGGVPGADVPADAASTSPTSVGTVTTQPAGEGVPGGRTVAGAPGRVTLETSADEAAAKEALATVAALLSPVQRLLS